MSSAALTPADEEREPSVRQHEVVEEVAADLARRNRDASDLGRAEAQAAAGQHFGLNLPRQFQLAPQPFPLDDQSLMPLQIFGHLVERGGEGAELVVRLDRNAGVEIAAGQLAHALRQRGEVPGHAVRDRDDADERQADDEEAEGEGADRRAANLAERGSHWPRDAERQAAAVLARDHQPLADAARLAAGRKRRVALDLEPLKQRLLLRVRRVQGSAAIDRERNLPLIASREGEHRLQRAIEIEHRVRLAEQLASLLDGDLDPASLDVHLHVAHGGGRCRLRFRQRFGDRLEARFGGGQADGEAMFDERRCFG
jgi:hypothetical protein